MLFWLTFQRLYKKSMVNPYILQMVRNSNRDQFLQSLFLPQAVRERVLVLLALDAELSHVRAHVSEEMLGHIRYAWWEESLTAIAEGKKPREHPVLQAIAEHQLAAPALQLAQKHRGAYPEPMGDSVDVTALVPKEVQAAWKRAGEIIARHRTRYGKKRNNWLTTRLLFAGVWR
jgi:hypothetical protein